MNRFCVSVDVEEDLPGIVPAGTKGIEEGLPGLMRLFSDLSITADFFFLSSVAREYPDLVHETAKRGHGIGNHGLDHQYLCAKPAAQQRDEILASTRTLEELLGTPPRNFRAADFSVTFTTLSLLDQAGYAVDSSVLPGRRAKRRFHTIYDHRGASVHPHHPRHLGAEGKTLSILEVPVTSNPLRFGAPFGLGALNTFGHERISAVMNALALPVIVFLLHPWELIDLASAHPGLPIGYTRACSADLEGLRAFLSKAKSEFTLTTMADLSSLGQGILVD